MIMKTPGRNECHHINHYFKQVKPIKHISRCENRDSAVSPTILL